MFYTDEEINDVLTKLNLKNDVFFVSLLPSFVWDKVGRCVVEYASSPNEKNDLYVIETDLIKLNISLEDYIKKQKIDEKEILVFCINPDFFPKISLKNKERWIRIKIMK